MDCISASAIRFKISTLKEKFIIAMVKKDKNEKKHGKNVEKTRNCSF